METAAASIPHRRIREVRSPGLVGLAGSDHPTADLAAAAKQLLQRLFQFGRLKAERAAFAFVGHAIPPIDQVDSIGPARIGLLGRVVEPIKNCGKLDSQLANTGARDLATLLGVVGTGKYNLVLHVALGLPDITRMRLQDVHDQESDLLVVLIIKPVESGNLPPERRSGITAEYEHHGLMCRQR